MAGFNSVHSHQPFPCTDSNSHGKWRSHFAKTEPYCVVGVISLAVGVEIKNLSTYSVSVCEQRLLQLLLIVCDPSEQCAFSRNQRFRLRYDLLISFPGEIHIKFIVMAPNENNADLTDETYICTCPVFKWFYFELKIAQMVFPATAF